MTADLIISRAKQLVEKKIDCLLSENDNDFASLIEAMRYSALAGGKRLRPVLLLEFYRLCGGKNNDDAACFAAAVEFIHTYSLIHDDLPCMDNDDMRRGRPACHIAFGEDTALLAGDALLTAAFYAASSSNVNPEFAVKAIKTLSKYAGVCGMVGGQVIDLAISGNSPTVDTVKKMYSLKTGALISAAAEIGCIIAGADNKKITAARTFSQNIGLAFQIVDDILDLTGSAAELGKPIGSDQKNQKSTYVSINGLEKSRDDVRTLTDDAIRALEIFGPDSIGLSDLAISLVDRKK